MSPLRTLAAAAALGTCAGCVTQAQLMQRDEQIMRLMREQRRQIDGVQRELERLRSDVEGGGVRRGRGGSTDQRIAALEERVTRLEGGAVTPAPSPGAPQALPPAGGLPPVVSVEPPVVEPPVGPVGKLTADWDQSVAAERAAVAAVDVPERADFEEILGTLAQRDCGPAVPRLNAFAASHKTSPLADNALYWAGRCYILMGDSTPQRSTDFYNQAIAKFYDLGTTYPEGEKTPAALWEQGQLFLEMNDEPDARIVFSRLIRDYPGSPEAARARQKLADLQQ
ncbi:MAG TPA: tetratricopeptide repeat protein [Candidatus Limnocylindria bacterium]|nr:tetratricopeptide repeat protein [Candidatus Limnocylindria bacterium]